MRGRCNELVGDGEDREEEVVRCHNTGTADPSGGFFEVKAACLVAAARTSPSVADVVVVDVVFPAAAGSARNGLTMSSAPGQRRNRIHCPGRRRFCARHRRRGPRQKWLWPPGVSPTAA